MKLIYGSTAIKYWYPEFPRIPKDLDYICEDTSKTTKEIEYHWTKAFEYLRWYNANNQYVEPNLLYTIKMSHISWDINFDKHLKDIHFLRDKGCKLNEQFYHLLYKDWEILHKQKRINLNVKNEEFFNENVNRKYQHDWLHDHFKHYDRPLYESIKIDKSKALTHQNLWENLSYENKFKCALEEIYVIAFERFIEPHGYPIKYAKYRAMKHLITSMTKGYFNIFLVENFDKLYYYDNEYFQFKIKELM